MGKTCLEALGGKVEKKTQFMEKTDASLVQGGCREKRCRCFSIHPHLIPSKKKKKTSSAKHCFLYMFHLFSSQLCTPTKHDHDITLLSVVETALEAGKSASVHSAELIEQKVMRVIILSTMKCGVFILELSFSMLNEENQYYLVP